MQQLNSGHIASPAPRAAKHLYTTHLQDLRGLDARAQVQSITIPDFELASGTKINARAGFCVFSERPGILDLNKTTVVLLSNISGSCMATVPKGAKASQCDGWFNHAIGTGMIDVLIRKKIHNLQPLLSLEDVNVICFDFLGGNGSQGALVTGSTSAKELGSVAREVQLIDSVNLQTQVLGEILGINNVTVVGGSMGGNCALMYLTSNQDYVTVDKVLDISSPSTLSDRTREFFVCQQRFLEHSRNAPQLINFLDRLRNEFNVNRFDSPGYDAALNYCEQRVRSLPENANSQQRLEVCRILSLLIFLPPQGFNERFSGWLASRQDPATKMENYLCKSGEDYTQVMDPHAYSNLVRMMIESPGFKAKDIIDGVRKHNAIFGRFLVSEDTFVSNEIEAELNASLKSAIDFSIFRSSDPGNGHDHFLDGEFTRTSASNLRVFLNNIEPRPNLNSWITGEMS